MIILQNYELIPKNLIFPVADQSRLRSTAALLLGMLTGIPPGAWLSAYCVCCQVEVSATGLSLVQRNPTQCDVSESDQVQ